MPLRVEKFANGRTKIYDRFSQDWLSRSAQRQQLTSDPHLYELVPTHRMTAEAERVLEHVNSLRIALPTAPDHLEYLYHLRRAKVLEAVEPTDRYFFGLIKSLTIEYGSGDWLAKVRRNMDTATLRMLAMGLHINPESHAKFVQDFCRSDEPEPDHAYDCKVRFSDLLQDTQAVITRINKAFGITVDETQLRDFGDSYRAWLASS